MAIDPVVQALHADGKVWHLRGERYAVAADFDDEPLLSIDRGAAGAFGIKTCGVHLVGYVGDGTATRVWIAQRAADKPTWPGKLDLLAAGGQPMGISLHDNLVKEAQEEAGVPAALARCARPTGMVSFLTESRYGIDNGIGIAYDLALPAHFAPYSVDGEVSAFELWPVERLVERLATTDDFVFDSALVAIDFLIRHGFCGPDDPDYLEIGLGLRR